MNKLLYTISVFLIIAIVTSCNDDFLSTDPLDSYSDAAVWSDPVLIELFVNGIYGDVADPLGTMGGKGGNGLTAILTDEGYNTHNSSSCQNFTKGLVTPDALYGFGDLGASASWEWSNNYEDIRKCNMFLDHTAGKTYDDQDWMDRMTGEVYFFRAFFYHYLVASYGGVPIIDFAYSMSDDPLIARNTYEECIDFIVSDLDKAADLLPEVQDDEGRITKGAALALKSRVLLYAASKLHNNNTLFSSYSNPELVGYTTSSTTDRWEAARDAAKAVIDLGIYSLYKGEPAAGDSISENISDYFLTKSMTSEDIFIRYYSVEGTGSNVQLFNGPNGWYNWSSATPLQNFVDSYEMADGSKFNWDDPAQAANPYANRDPRFHATILYNGSYWKERSSDALVQESKYPDLMIPGCVQTCHWEIWNGSEEVTVNGLDTREGPIESWNGSYTGYCLRKWLDPAITASFSNPQEIPCRYMRYAEVLLNYAEACIELNLEEPARWALNLIRKRAGMPDITETGDALKEEYRNERKIELAFEDHRFFDIRRWMIGEEAIVPAKKIYIVYPLNPDHTTSTQAIYTVSEFDQRSWDDSDYLMPIDRDETNKNALLIQNPFYE